MSATSRFVLGGRPDGDERISGWEQEQEGEGEGDSEGGHENAVHSRITDHSEAADTVSGMSLFPQLSLCTPSQRHTRRPGMEV